MIVYFVIQVLTGVYFVFQLIYVSLLSSNPFLSSIFISDVLFLLWCFCRHLLFGVKMWILYQIKQSLTRLPFWALWSSFSVSTLLHYLPISTVVHIWETLPYELDFYYMLPISHLDFWLCRFMRYCVLCCDPCAGCQGNVQLWERNQGKMWDCTLVPVNHLIQYYVYIRSYSGYMVSLLNYPLFSLVINNWNQFWPWQCLFFWTV